VPISLNSTFPISTCSGICAFTRCRAHCQAANFDFLSNFAPLTIFRWYFVVSRMCIVRIAAIILLLLSLLPMVSDPGDGVRGGTPEVPCRSIITVNASGSGDYISIQNAINNAINGDTIYVEPGIYQENIVVNKSLNIIGDGANITTIDGSNSGNVVIVTKDQVNISGFHIQNSGNGDFHDHLSGIKLNDVENCSVLNNILSNRP